MRKNPNIVLVLIDSLRPQHLSCYGYPRPTSPALDALAEEGVLYENAFAVGPWTVPSVSSILTGLYPSQHQVCGERPVLDGPYRTLSEVLRDAGYTTLGITANVWTSSNYGHHRGYEEYVKIWQLWQTTRDVRTSVQHTQRSGRGDYWKHIGNQILLGNPLANMLNSFYGKFLWRRVDKGGGRLTRIAQRWVAQQAQSGNPFFLFLFYLEPHVPYRPRRDLAGVFLPPGRSFEQACRVNQEAWPFLAGRVPMTEQDFEILKAFYDGEIRYVDGWIGQLLQALRDQRLEDNTLFIVMADHGDNIGDHGLWGHHFCLYDSLLHVPCLIRFPRDFPAGMRVDHIVQTTDVFATVMRALELDTTALPQALVGRDIRPGSWAEGPERVALAEYYDGFLWAGKVEKKYPGTDMSRFRRNLKMARTREWKYIWSSDGQHELYHLTQDPEEWHNVVGRHPEVAQELHRHLQQHLGWGDELQVQPVEVDEGAQRLLEGLGYL